MLRRKTRLFSNSIYFSGTQCECHNFNVELANEAFHVWQMNGSWTNSGVFGGAVFCVFCVPGDAACFGKRREGPSHRYDHLPSPRKVNSCETDQTGVIKVCIITCRVTHILISPKHKSIVPHSTAVPASLTPIPSTMGIGRVTFHPQPPNPLTAPFPSSKQPLPWPRPCCPPHYPLHSCVPWHPRLCLQHIHCMFGFS